MDRDTPILVMGDAPNLPSGLARIARDLTAHLFHSGYKVAQLGLGYDGQPFDWRVYPLWDADEWGKDDLKRVWEWHCGDTPGVLLTVWDPARCFGASGVEINGERWGYFAVDAANIHDKISGPAEEGLRRYSRVLAYGEWGAGVLSRTLGRKVPWLPHGINKDVFKIREEGPPRNFIGAVATNQPRKDWSVVFEVFRDYHAQSDLNFWVHIDKPMTQAWVLHQLILDYEIDVDRLLVTQEITDEMLAGLYNQCLFTVAPGLGEGFGYPIVESLACGAPVVHVDHAGGAELIPVPGWKMQPASWRREGSYCLVRPVLESVDVLRAYRAAYEAASREETKWYCAGAVAHLDWENLWPYWAKWLA